MAAGQPGNPGGAALRTAALMLLVLNTVDGYRPLRLPAVPVPARG
jgi:hypothetical protein